MMKLTKIDTQFKLHNYQSLFIVSIYSHVHDEADDYDIDRNDDNNAIRK